MQDSHRAYRMPIKFTSVILSLNEAPNLARVLEKLHFAEEIVVLDSGSTDATVDIAQQYPRVRLATRSFESHATQWNYAIHQMQINTPWVLALDADYVLEDALIEEIKQLEPAGDVNGFLIRCKYAIGGKILRTSLYPPQLCLYRVNHAHYLQEGHTQRIRVEGKHAQLNGYIVHDDRKPFARWLQSQQRYAKLEAERLHTDGFNSLRWQDKLRKCLVITPVLVPIYLLFVRGLILDGLAGLRYACERGIAESFIATALFGRYLRIFI